MTDGARVAIVGGGISGLCIARQLACDERVAATVFEANAQLGGLLATTRDQGFLCERAANAFLPSPDGALDLCEALGVPIAEAASAAKNRWIYTRGRLCPLPSGPREFLSTDLISTRAKLRLLLEPLRRRPRTTDETVLDFGRRRLGPEVARNVLAPFVTGVFAGEASELSVRAAFPRLAELEKQGGLLLGSIRAQLRNRHSPRPSRRLAAPHDGAGALMTALADEVSASCRVVCGDPVQSITSTSDGVVVSSAGVQHNFDTCVLALPAHAARAIVAADCPELAELLSRIPAVPVATVHLGYRRDQVEHPLNGFGFLTVRGEDLRVLGVVFESSLWPNRAPDNAILVRAIYGGARDPAAASLNDDELTQLAQRELSATLGVTGPPVFRRTWRAERAIPQYRLGHTGVVERASQLARDRRIVLAGNSYRGVSVNDCVSGAAGVARGVLALLTALCIVSTASSCAGGAKSPAVAKDDAGDAGDSSATRAVPPDAAGLEVGVAASYAASASVANPGSIEVTVVWPHAAAAHLRSPGVNECGQPRPAPLSVHTLWGVHDAVVTLKDISSGRRAPPKRPIVVAHRDCQLRPRVSVVDHLGAPLSIVNDDERPTAVQIFEGAQTKARYAMRLAMVGQQYQIDVTTPTVMRIRSARGKEDAWVIAPGHPYVKRTDDKGHATLAEVPAGEYQLEAWHPPLKPGRRALRVTKRIHVAARQATTVRVVLKP